MKKVSDNKEASDSEGIAVPANALKGGFDEEAATMVPRAGCMDVMGRASYGDAQGYSASVTLCFLSICRTEDISESGC